ncbi:P-loop containing nucleoside triphosphate hydrolase protein [Zopfochytrium polystomum]|nr:P-loop containing nucleoside triphosphate hydrolase protein [Zopfochytrium polystomum]
MSPKKVIVLGSAGCGKTCLVTRGVANTFQPEYRQSFGADLAVKLSVDSKKHNMQIWCCGGHERYRALLDQFFSEADVAVLCYDLTSAASFRELAFWYSEVKRLFFRRVRAASAAEIVLVGTKADEADNLQVKSQDGIKQAAEWNAEFRAVSSKTGLNIVELFDHIFKLFK